jgi:hypothetical protein
MPGKQAWTARSNGRVRSRSWDRAAGDHYREGRARGSDFSGSGPVPRWAGRRGSLDYGPCSSSPGRVQGSGRAVAEAEQAARVACVVVGPKSGLAPAQYEVRSRRVEQCPDGVMSHARFGGTGLHAQITVARGRIDGVADKCGNRHERPGRRPAMTYRSWANSDGPNPTVRVNPHRRAVAVSPQPGLPALEVVNWAGEKPPARQRAPSAAMSVMALTLIS